MGTSRPSALFILLSCVLALAQAQVAPCPAPEALKPCTCDYTGINCMRAKSTAELAKAFSGQVKTIHRALWMHKVPIENVNKNTLGSFAFGKVYVEVNSNLTSFPLSSLEKSSRYLTELSFYGNAFKSLSSIDYKWLPRFGKLLTLNLAKNSLSILPVEAFSSPSLETLSLSENPISSIGAYAFRDLPRLKNLQLRFLRVKTLGAYSLAITKHDWQLKVSISASRVQTIQKNAFDGIAPLTLDLAHNNLREFSAPVFHPLISAMALNAKKYGMLGDARIATRGNPFTCTGCGYSWLTTLKNQPDVMLMLVDFRCPDATPVWNITNARIGCPRSARL